MPESQYRVSEKLPGNEATAGEAMSAYAWLSKLNISPDAVCRCGHIASQHLHGKSCGAEIENFKFCKCEEFHEVKIQNQGDEMSKEKKVKKTKGEGRKPTLAPYVDSPFKVYMNVDGKERDAQVLSTGIIKYKEKEFTSPSSLATFIMKEAGQKGRADGWKVLSFNKDDKRVPLNVLRGAKSPLKAAEPKAKKERKPKAPKPPKAEKPKRVAAKQPRKPRAAKPEATAPAAQETSASETAA
jgi:hypothetical protein